MKLVEAQAKVKAALAAIRNGKPWPPNDTVDEFTQIVVALTVEAVGFHIAADGEICDPRPKQEWAPPVSRNWRTKRGR